MQMTDCYSRKEFHLEELMTGKSHLLSRECVLSSSDSVIDITTSEAKLLIESGMVVTNTCIRNATPSEI
jgi:hypothetical protein